MASDKRKTTESPRVPSNVPNDYDHLGVPTSLNMPLTGARRRQAQRYARRRMPNWVKALIAIGTGMAAFGVVALVILVIAFPPFFRGLEPRYQQRLIDMFPPFERLRPTVPFEVLPTLTGGSDSDAAQQLLFATATVTPAVTATPATLSTPVPTPTESGIPIGAVNTPQPTPLPTYVAPAPAALAPTWTPALAPTELPLPPFVKLASFRYEQQLWNNCGPTTMTMGLTYFGWTPKQETAARWMKPNPEDNNVSPWQMVRFVNEQTNVKALYRIGGTMTLLKRLLSAGFPVIIEESIQPSGEGWMGHYVLLIGYDESQQQFLSFDSYLGSNQEQGRPVPYSLFDESWRHFNRLFIVLYEPSREIELRGVLGDYADPTYAAQMARESARAEAARNRDDKWAWFNMGTAYVALGEYDSAAIAYDEARQLGLPWRMLWYQFGPYEAYFRVGRYNDVLSLADATLANTPYVEETYYWQGMVYAAQGDTSRALSKFNQALNYNRNFFPAQEAKAQIEAGTFQAVAGS